MLVVRRVLVASFGPGPMKRVQMIGLLDSGDLPETVVETWNDWLNRMLAHRALAFMLGFIARMMEIKVYKSQVHNHPLIEGFAPLLSADALKNQTLIGKSPVWSRLVSLFGSECIRACYIYKVTTTTTSKPKQKRESRLLLRIILKQPPGILQLLARKDQTLLIRWNAFFALDQSFEFENCFPRLEMEGDRLARRGRDKNVSLTPAEPCTIVPHDD